MTATRTDVATAYMVIFSPEQQGPENPDEPWIEQAYRLEQSQVFSSIGQAMKFANRTVKTAYFGEVLIRECYQDERGRWQEFESGGFSLNVYRNS